MLPCHDAKLNVTFPFLPWTISNIACENIRFSSFLGETDVFAGYFKYSNCGGLNVQSFRQMYWNLRDFMSILRWTDHELWLIANPPISLIDSFIDWFKLLLVNFLRFSFSVAISLWTNSFYFFDTKVLTS